MNRYYLVSEKEWNPSLPPPPTTLTEKATTALFPPVPQTPGDRLVKEHQNEKHGKTPEEIWRLYADLLTRYFQFRNMQPGYVPISYQNQVDDDKQKDTTQSPIRKNEQINLFNLAVEGMVGKMLRQKGREFINDLQSSGKAPHFDIQGHLINPSDGKPVHGSDVVSLIRYLIRERAQLEVPIGWELFMDLLRKNPAINNRKYKRLNDLTDDDDDDDSESVDTDYEDVNEDMVSNKDPVPFKAPIITPPTFTINKPHTVDKTQVINYDPYKPRLRTNNAFSITRK